MTAEPRPGPEPRPDAQPRSLLAAGMVVYLVMIAVALGSLAFRNRMPALAERAIGEHGVLLGSAAGLVVGVLAAWSLAWANPRIARLREFEAAAKQAFAGTSDAAALAFVVLGAVGEELFFRLAVQDAYGLVGSVAVATAVNSGLGGWRWLPIALLHAAALGLLVDLGFGLLASTTASAIMNHLNLRRIQCSPVS